MTEKIHRVFIEEEKGQGSQIWARKKEADRTQGGNNVADGVICNDDIDEKSIPSRSKKIEESQDPHKQTLEPNGDHRVQEKSGVWKSRR